MTAQDISYRTQRSQYGVQADYDTVIAASRRFGGLGFDLSPDFTKDEFSRMGDRWPVISQTGHVWTNVKGSGKPVYSDMPTIFSCVHRKITGPTTPGGGTNTRLWAYQQSTSEDEDVEALTIEQGNRKLAWRSSGIRLSGYTFTWDDLKTDFSCEGFGKAIDTGRQLSTNEVVSLAVTGGTPTSGSGSLAGTNPRTGAAFTVTTIPFNSTSTQAQARFDAAIGANNSKVTGGPWPASPLVVEFRGEFGQIDVAVLTPSDSFDVGNIAATVSTPGVAVTENAIIPVQSGHIKIYYDADSSAFGTTKLTRCYAGSLRIGSMREAHYVVDRDIQNTFVGHLEGDPEGALSVTIMANEDADTIYADALAGTSRAVRIEAVGPIIEGSLPYKVIWDAMVKARKIGERKAQGKALATVVDFGIFHDDTYGRALTASAQNTVTTLAT
jgi:hypothetical protein